MLKEGWIDLAPVMDLYGRKIIGYTDGTNMTADLALDAVKNACSNIPDTRQQVQNNIRKHLPLVEKEEI